MASLSALDLLSMSDAEQAILRCLNRQPQLPTPDIKAATGLAPDELETTLSQMVQKGLLVEQLVSEQRKFSVRFGRDTTAHVRNLPRNLLAVFEQTDDRFLEEIPLAAALAPEDRAAVLAKASRRKLLADEVLVWQGKEFDWVGVVRSGLLKNARLQGKQSGKQTTGYVRRTEWFGLGEALSVMPSLATCMAATKTELLAWSVEDFRRLVQNYPRLGYAIAGHLGRSLQHCQNTQVRGLGRTWAIGAVRPGAGATTLAINLAVMASNQTSHEGRAARVALWSMDPNRAALVQALGLDPDALSSVHGHETWVTHGSGVDIFLAGQQSDYPPQVQLDILLTNLQSQYDHIICDVGAGLESEFALRLTGQAEAFILLLTHAGDLGQSRTIKGRLQPYARPNQRLIVVQNRIEAGASVDPSVNATLPEDPVHLGLATEARQPLVDGQPGSPLGQAFQEIYQRLSLNHTIGVFIPSTIAVDQAADNRPQVEAALGLFGSLFGGATSNRADGVWRSEESGLVAEQITVVRTFVSQLALEKYLDEVVSFATHLKSEMKQEAIAIEVDDQLILV